jgi:transcriptional regulator with XRE-family HTH domain
LPKKSKLISKLDIIFQNKLSMKIDSNNVGAHLRSLREERGLPLRKLAALLDIDTSTLAKMEKGQRSFSLDMAPTLAKALDVDFKELQIALLASTVLQEVGNEEYAQEGLKMAVKQLSQAK